MIKSAPISQDGTGSTMLQPFVNGLMLIMVCPSIKRIKVGDIFLYFFFFFILGKVWDLVSLSTRFFICKSS